MTALTSDFQRAKSIHDLRLTALPVKAGSAVYTGALTCTETASGLAVPGSDSVGLTFQGVAHRGFDNSSGTDGVVDATNSTRYCEVDDNGPYSFPIQGSTPLAGQDAFIVDDNTVSADATVQNIRCGKFRQPDGLNTGWWLVDLER